MEPSEKLLGILREKIHERGLTYTEVAEKLSTTHGQVSRVLNGRNRLTTDDLNRYANLLGIPMSVLLKDAEQRDGRKQIPEDAEKYICEDARIYSIFASLNVPVTKEGLAGYLDLDLNFVEQVLERFLKEKIIFVPGPGLYQLTEHAIDIKFGKTKEFYDLKSEIYEIQSQQTFENLSRGKDYWADKDDSMLVPRLTPAQVFSIAKQLESLSAQIRTMDQMNAFPRGESIELHTVFIALKPMSKDILRSLHQSKSK